MLEKRQEQSSATEPSHSPPSAHHAFEQDVELGLKPQQQRHGGRPFGQRRRQPAAKVGPTSRPVVHGLPELVAAAMLVEKLVGRAHGQVQVPVREHEGQEARCRAHVYHALFDHVAVHVPVC